jgi:hypothetical protein
MRSRAVLLLVLTCLGGVVHRARPQQRIHQAYELACRQDQRTLVGMLGGLGELGVVVVAVFGTVLSYTVGGFDQGIARDADCRLWPARYPLPETRPILAASRRAPQTWPLPPHWRTGRYRRPPPADQQSTRDPGRERNPRCAARRAERQRPGQWCDPPPASDSATCEWWPGSWSG